MNREGAMEGAQREYQLQQFIANLERQNEKNIHTREDEFEGPTHLETKDGEKFSVEKITNAKDKRIKGAHDLLAKHFPPSEMDSFNTFEAAVEGKVVGDEEGDFDEPTLNIHTVEKDGEVVGTSQSSVLESFDENQEGTGKQFLMEHYVMVDESQRNKGLDTELFRKMMIDAKKQAPNLSSAVVETTTVGEKFYNRLGLKRPYIEMADGTMKEVPYFQEVLADAWDKQTGEPKPGQERSPQHLMIANLDRDTNEMTTEELKEIIRAIHDYNSFQTEGYFKGNKQAHAKHEEIMKGHMKELEDFVAQAKDGKIKLMSSSDRQQSDQEITDHAVNSEK